VKKQKNIHLEKDTYFLNYRFIALILLTYIVVFVVNIVLKHNTNFSLNLMYFNVLALLSILIILYFITNRIIIQADSKQIKTLIFKNIYGINIQKINFDTIQKFKIYYNLLPINIISTQKVFLLFGEKYEKTIEIKIKTNNKNYNFNGQILTYNSLQILTSKF
jgi:hypothetical protein